jgi:hypothetical protein
MNFNLLSVVFDDLSTKSRRASAHKNTIGLPILFLEKKRIDLMN